MAAFASDRCKAAIFSAVCSEKRSQNLYKIKNTLQNNKFSKTILLLSEFPTNDFLIKNFIYVIKKDNRQIIEFGL